MTTSIRHLVLVLGDQLDEAASAFSGFDPQQDAVWMAEVDEESTHVVSAKQRTTLFLSAMRHFAAALRDKGWQVFYSELDAVDNRGSLAGELEKGPQPLQRRGAKPHGADHARLPRALRVRCPPRDLARAGRGGDIRLHPQALHLAPAQWPGKRRKPRQDRAEQRPVQ